MSKKGIIHKLKFVVLAMLLLCLNILGYNPKVGATMENGQYITIDSPLPNSYVKNTAITVSGKVGNFNSAVTIILRNGTDIIDTIDNIQDEEWTTTLLFDEGTYTIKAEATGADGKTAEPVFITFTIDSTPPPVAIEEPINGSTVKTSTIKGTSEANATIEVCMDCNLVDGVIHGTWSSNNITVNPLGQWTYLDDKLVDGNHTYFIRAKDRAGNIGTFKSGSFILDQTRPVVIVSSTDSTKEPYPKQDMTQVPIDATIKVFIQDATEINKQLAEDNSITLTQFSTKTPVQGRIVYKAETKELTFTPAEPLLAGKKYKISINGAKIIDQAGNESFPKAWMFTTKATTGGVHKNPHGGYGDNVNTCVNCHSTHVSTNPKLLTQKDQTGAANSQTPTVDHYCMSCHDGTVAPVPEKSQSTHTHNVAVSMDGNPSGSSCSSCHNPHLDWSEGNPNLTQDHIVYQHQPDLTKPEKPTGKVSSKEQLCESCHENDSIEKISNPAVEYRLFQYKKSNTAIGILEDYKLCLRCHNQSFSSKYEGIPIIETFYNNLTEATKLDYENKEKKSYSTREISPEEKNFSGHIIKAIDGSPLAGHLPCAECHSSHGSDNIKQLKNKYGHGGRVEAKFSMTSGEWTASKEFEFCVKCHNGVTTVYGVNSKALSKESHLDFYNGQGNLLPANSITKKCSSCHGGTSKSFLEASHAPKRVTPLPIEPLITP